MYYCEKCRVKNEWPDAFVRSSGKCECCGESAVCWDRPSSSLPRVVRPVANNVAAQAGDEPMRKALQVCVKALEFRKERSANDEFALNLARIALAEAPRATADVEREQPSKELLLEAIADKVGRAEDLMSDFPPHRAMERWNEANHTLREIVDELFATKKPGA